MDLSEYVATALNCWVGSALSRILALVGVTVIPVRVGPSDVTVRLAVPSLPLAGSVAVMVTVPRASDGDPVARPFEPAPLLMTAIF